MKITGVLKIASTLTMVLWTGVAFPQQIIEVIGSKDGETIKQHVELFLNHLDVHESLHLRIFFSTKMPEKLEGITLSHPSPEPGKYQIIRVLIDAKLNRRRQMLVLAHEMIHVKQYAKNELVILDDRRVKWKEKEYVVSEGPNLYTPWENEAHHADFNLMRLFKYPQKQMQKSLDGLVADTTSNTSSTCSHLTLKCAGKTKTPL